MLLSAFVFPVQVLETLPSTLHSWLQVFGAHK